MFLSSLRGQPRQKLRKLQKKTRKKKRKNPKSSCSRRLYFLRKVIVHTHREREKKGSARSSSAPFEFPSARTSDTNLRFLFFFSFLENQSDKAAPLGTADKPLLAFKEEEIIRRRNLQRLPYRTPRHVHYTCDRPVKTARGSFEKKIFFQKKKKKKPRLSGRCAAGGSEMARRGKSERRKVKMKNRYFLFPAQHSSALER